MDTNRVVLSNSKLTTAEGCGYEYYLAYVERAPRPTKPPLIRGGVVHETIRHSMRTKQDTMRLPSPEEIADLAATTFEKDWRGQEVYLGDEDDTPGAVKDRTKDTVVQLAGLHLMQVAPTVEPNRPEGVEVKVIVEPKDVALRVEGTIDLLAVEDGHVIRDAKTAEKSPSADMADKSQQAGVYNFLYLAKYGKLPRGFVLDYLVRTPKKGDLKSVRVPETGTSTRDMADVQAIIHRINAVADMIRKEAWVPASPNAWWCPCTYAVTGQCPFVRRGDSRPKN